MAGARGLDRRQQVGLAERLDEVAEDAGLDRARRRAPPGRTRSASRSGSAAPRGSASPPRSRRAAASSRRGSPRPAARTRQLDRLDAVAGLGADLVPGALEQAAQVEADDRLVFGDQDRARPRSLGARTLPAADRPASAESRTRRAPNGSPVRGRRSPCQLRPSLDVRTSPSSFTPARLEVRVGAAIDVGDPPKVSTVPSPARSLGRRRCRPSPTCTAACRARRPSASQPSRPVRQPVARLEARARRGTSRSSARGRTRSRRSSMFARLVRERCGRRVGRGLAHRCLLPAVVCTCFYTTTTSMSIVHSSTTAGRCRCSPSSTRRRDDASSRSRTGSASAASRSAARSTRSSRRASSLRIPATATRCAPSTS